MRRHSLTALVFLTSLLALAAPARAELDGPWETPYGHIKIEREGEQLVGRLTEATKACGYARGAEVLHGKVQDDLFTGEVRVCFPTKCREDGWILMLAVVSHERWTGWVAEVPECPNTPRGSFPLTRVKAAAPLPAPTPTLVEASHKFKNADAEEYFRQARSIYSSLEVDSSEKALKRLRKAEQLEPNQPEVLLLIGEIQQARKNYGEARVYYARGAKVDPVNGNYNLACLSAVEGSAKEALKFLRFSADRGFARPEDLQADKDLVSLHDDPEWTNIMRKVERNRAEHRGGR